MLGGRGGWHALSYEVDIESWLQSQMEVCRAFRSKSDDLSQLKQE